MIERRLTVLVGDNGTVEILPPRTDQGAGHRWLSIILLCIGFLVGSFLCLTALLGLIFTSKSHRPSCLQWLTLAALLDCVQGQMFGAAFVTTRPTDSSSLSDERHHIWCSLSAALSLSLLLAQAGYIAALALQVKSEPRKSFYKACYSALPLLLSIAVAVEAFFRSPVNYFPNRNGCGFVNHLWSTTPIWQPYTVLTLVILAVSGLTSIHGLLGRQQQLASSSKDRYETDKTVLKTLTILFVFLVIPYGALMIVTPLTNTSSASDELKFGFKWYETFLTWLRYQFNNLLPIVVLICYKEVRKEGKSTLMFWCRKNNAVHGCSGMNGQKLYTARKRRSKNGDVVRKNTNPEIPVLFATTKGLYLRTVQNTQGSRSVCGSENFTDMEKTILCEPCDFFEFDSSRLPSRSQSFCSSSSRLPSRANVTPDLTKESTVTESAAKRRNVVRFSEEVIELPAAAESGVWSDPDEIAKRNRDEMETRTVKSSLGSTYTKLK